MSLSSFNHLDIELPKATNTSALSSAGVMRLFNKVGETVNKITYKMDETDPVSSVNVLEFAVELLSFLLVKYSQFFYVNLTSNFLTLFCKM